MKKYSCLFFVGIMCITTWSGFAQNTLKKQETSSNYQSARDLIKKEKYASAYQSFKEIANSASSSELLKAEARFYMALSGLQLGHRDAEGEFLTFIRNYPTDAKTNLAYYELGAYYYRGKEYEKTVKYLSETDLSFLDEKKQQEVTFDLAYSYFMMKELDKAEKLFDQIKSHDHKYKYASNYYAGFIKFKKGKYNEAVRDLKIAEQNEVYNRIVPYMIVNIYYKKADYDALINYAEPILKSKNKISKKSDILLLTAESHFVKKSYAKAASYFNTYLKKKGMGNREVVYRAGYSNLQTNDIAQSIECFKEIANTSDSLGQYASYYLGQSYIKNDNKIYALSAFKEASKVSFNGDIQENALYDVARLNYELENFEQAIIEFKRYTEKYPNKARTQRAEELMTDAFVYSDDYNAALKFLESKSSLTPKMQKNYQHVAYLKGIELYNKKQFQTALSYFDKSLKYQINPAIHLENYFWKGETYSRLYQWSKAQNEYAQVFRAGDQRSLLFLKSRYGIGYAYFNKKEFVKAKEHFSKFVENATKSTNVKVLGDAMLRLADCYFFEKGYDQAIKHYLGAIERPVPGIDYAYYQLGLVYELKGNNDKASEQFLLVETTFKRSPFKVKASYNRARIAFEGGEYRNAKKLFTSFLTSYPNDRLVPVAFVQRGKAYFNLKNYSASLADYDVVLNDYCQNEVAQIALTSSQQTLTTMGKGAEFEVRLNKFAECNPSNGEIERIRFEAAEQNYDAFESELAIKNLRRFITNYPTSVYKKKAIYYLAKSYKDIGDNDSALVYFEHVKREGNPANYEDALIELSSLYVKDENYTAGKEISKELLTTASSKRKQAVALSNLIVSLYYLNQYDSTIAYADYVLNDANAPSYMKAEAAMYHAKASYEIGELDKALDEFLHITNTSKDIKGAEANYLVGLILHEQKKYNQSLEVLYELNKVYVAYGKWITSSFFLIAENNYELGEVFQSKATLQSLIDHSGDTTVVEKAKKRLAEIEEAEKIVPEEELMEVIDLDAPKEEAIQQVDSTNAVDE